MDYRGPEYMRRKLNQKRLRIQTRYRYYDMKNAVRDFNAVTPPEFRSFNEVLGWCGKAVDALADRLVFRGFRNDNFDLKTIYQMNNQDILFDSAMLSALISSCCFLYIAPDDMTGFPRIQVIDGGNATGEVDQTTGLLKEGYAVLSRDDNNTPILEAWFKTGETVFWQKGGTPWTIYNDAPAPLLVPIIHRPDAARPFGHSRISRACMSIMQGALRTLKRSEISAEFYSFPQKYVLGMDPDAEPLDKWRATISSLLTISADENGNKPSVGQFQQQSMAPYTEQIRTFASLFSGETGLTLDDLGFPSDNPSSAEAIEACHTNLSLAGEKAQRCFGTGFLNAGFLAACVRDNFAYNRQQFCQTTARWYPIFKPDAGKIAAIGDAVGKINQAVPGYFDSDALDDLTGIFREE